MKALSMIGGFLRRHKKAEEKLAEGAAASLGLALLKRVLAAGVAAAAIAAPAMIDLSNNNGAGAASAISAPGVHAVEAKATEGLGFRDGLYPTFRAAASRAHKPFGGYLFLHPSASGKAQADYFIAYARPKAGDLQPVVDDELGSPCASASSTLAALHELVAHGYSPVLYTSAYWLGQLARCAPALKAFPVWEAEYGPVLTRVSGFHVIAWQYTDNSGVKGLRIDGSRLLVPVSSLVIGSQPAPKPKPSPAKVLAARKAKLRAEHGGFWAWYAWREARGSWKGLAPHEHDARPAVKHRIPRRWWTHLERIA